MRKCWSSELRYRLLGLIVIATTFLFSGIPLLAFAEEQGSTFASGLKLYGFVDTSYTHNFNNPNDPANPNPNANALRIFDVDANSFRPHLAQVVLEKEGKTDGALEDRAGFRIKLNFGEDAKLTGGDGDDADFQEAYAQFIAPVGNGLDLRFGRMNTLVGYEVIESPYNPNFSRSWLFGFGQPFTTTGVRLSYTVNDYVSFSIGGINSFNGATQDANRGKSVEALVALTPLDRVALTIYAFYGPEGALGASEVDRLLGGGILDIQVTDKAEIVLEAYYANQANASKPNLPNATTNPAGNARWDGVAGYLIYDFTDRWGARIRGEVFEDSGGALTGTDQTIWETTFTLEHKPVPSLITRWEFRYDKSDKAPFRFGTRAANHQETLGFEVIYLF